MIEHAAQGKVGKKSPAFEPALVQASKRPFHDQLSQPVLLLHFLQLWAEGQNLEMQEMLREQPSKKKSMSINLINDVLQMLVELSREQKALMKMGDGALELLERVLSFLIEVVQGESAQNKLFIAKLNSS